MTEPTIEITAGVVDETAVEVRRRMPRFYRNWLVARIGWSVVTLFGVSILVFVVLRVIPGNQIEAAFVWQQDSVHSRASSLARFELAGSWRLQAEFVPRIRAVTAADLERVARTYFPAERKNVAVLLPAEEPSPATK